MTIRMCNGHSSMSHVTMGLTMLEFVYNKVSITPRITNLIWRWFHLIISQKCRRIKCAVYQTKGQFGQRISSISYQMLVNLVVLLLLTSALAFPTQSAKLFGCTHIESTTKSNIFAFFCMSIPISTAQITFFPTRVMHDCYPNEFPLTSLFPSSFRICDTTNISQNYEANQSTDDCFLATLNRTN